MKHGSKSAFVRSQPLGMSAKDVVAAAKKEHMKLSIAQVYNIRSTTKLKGKPMGGVKAKAVRSAPAASAKSSKSSNGSSAVVDMAEAQLRRLIADVGLARSRQIVSEVSATFAG